MPYAVDATPHAAIIERDVVIATFRADAMPLLIRSAITVPRDIADDAYLRFITPCYAALFL